MNLILEPTFRECIFCNKLVYFDSIFGLCIPVFHLFNSVLQLVFLFYLNVKENFSLLCKNCIPACEIHCINSYVSCWSITDPNISHWKNIFLATMVTSTGIYFPVIFLRFRKFWIKQRFTPRNTAHQISLDFFGEIIFSKDMAQFFPSMVSFAFNLWIYFKAYF